MIGQYLTGLLKDRSWPVDRQMLNIADASRFAYLLSSTDVAAVVNAAGVVNSDRKTLFDVNAFFPAQMAKQCRELDIPLVYLSSGRVFNGKGSVPYVESDPPDPIDDYGLSKYLGEKFVADALMGKRYFIVRMPMVLGYRAVHPEGMLVTRLLELAKRGKPVAAAIDVYNSVVYAGDVAAAVEALIDGPEKSGIYHLTSGDGLSLYEIVNGVFRAIDAGLQVTGVPSSHFGEMRRLPRFTVLATEKTLRLPGHEAVFERFTADYMAEELFAKR